MLKGAVIGCGDVAAAFHFPAQQASDEITTVAAADTDRTRLEDVAGRFGVSRIYTDYTEMLSSEELDFVTVCLPPRLHRAAIEAAARNAVNVLCEKPMAPSPEDVERIVEAVAVGGIKLMVSQNFRWFPDVVTAVAAIRAGALGDVFSVRVEEFVWELEHSYRNTQEHFVLLEHGVHYLDLLRHVVGDEPERIHAVTRFVPAHGVAGESLASIAVEFRNGVLGRIDNCVCAAEGEQTVLRMRVDGTRGVLLLNSPDAPLKIYSTASGEGRWIFPETSSRVAADLPPSEYPWPMNELKASVRGVYGALCAYLAGGAEPPTTAVENAKTMRLVFAAYQSAEEHRVVELACSVDGSRASE